MKGEVNDTRFWLDRSVLVTGATGLMGSWLTRTLKRAQADIVVLIRDWEPQSELVRSGLVNKVRIVRGDVRNQRLLERILAEYEVDTVYHLAAQTIVPIANRSPVSTFDSNIRGTWALLEACRRSPTVRQIVVASSDKAYGEHLTLPYREEVPLQGRFPYDASKTCADLLAQCYARTYQLPVVITRNGNLYGGGDLNWNRVVPGTIRAVIRDQRPIIRSDGSLTRDYFFVEDAAHACLNLAERLAADRSLIGEAFNFSNESPLRVKEVVQHILALMGREDLQPVIKNEMSNEIPHQYLDAEKARTKLGWKPRYTLAEGLGPTIDWYRAYFKYKGGDD